MIVDLAAPSLNYKVLEGKVFFIVFFPEFLESLMNINSALTLIQFIKNESS